jgi:tetratricopeptide (TPR) repeat protein
VRYRAFISYSHADAATAAWLHRKLEGWRVPQRMRAENPALPERLAPIFRDREELAGASELGPQIEAALADSEALIVVCSPEAAASRWVDAEVRAFRSAGSTSAAEGRMPESGRESGRGARVFALIVGGEPGSGDARECFPPALREDGAEPLAADLRPGKDGKELALLKLISGLIGVPLDSLRQREARRRHQRMLALTSIALAVMLVTSFLAVQAVLARQAAERRQKQAEALVGFMLGDLNDKLSEVARLDILEGVHDHAMEYFESLPTDDVTDEALAQRARALVQIGNVRMEQGHLPQALKAYLASGELSERLAKANPDDVKRQLAHAELLAYVGTNHWYQGDLDAAQRSFEASRAVLARAQALAPKSHELLFQLGTVDNNAGHVLEGRGRLAEASRMYTSMLATAQELVALDASNANAQILRGLAHNNLAKMALLQGDLAGAVAGYRADVAIEAELARRDPKDNAQAERVLLARGALGRTLALTGALDEAATEVQYAVVAAERLHALEPDSTNLQENVPIYATPLARLRRLQGNAPAARAAAARALAVADALLGKSADHPGWRRQRAEALIEQSEQALGAGDLPGARRAL